MNFSLHYLVCYLKRIIDYVFTIVSLTVLSPLIAVLAVLIKVTSSGPVIYSQERVGKNGKRFTLYKFRSMISVTGDNLPLITDIDDKRITRIGKFMRKHKLDEIPNFINVLKGEMSIVGPRPEQQYYVEQLLRERPDYIETQKTLPGMTSWGQVKFGYASDIEEMKHRLDYDLYYVKNRSFLFDLKIVLLTIGIVLKGEGI